MRTIEDYAFLFDRNKDTTRYHVHDTLQILETTDLTNGSYQVRVLGHGGWKSLGEMTPAQLINWLSHQ
jgi:hypothetical protein